MLIDIPLKHKQNAVIFFEVLIVQHFLILKNEICDYTFSLYN